MKSNDFIWHGGRVVHWDLDDLDLNKGILQQIDILKEDLALIEYDNDIIIGLGWLPEFNPDGRFVLDVIKSEDWDNPIAQIEAKNAASLEHIIKQAVSVARSASRT